MVFSDAVMRERLPQDTYAAVQRTMRSGRRLHPDTAEVVAAAMKDWALEKGATHFTHWFQPMTGVTAEKHDSFLAPDGAGGVIMEFSGKELIHGEPDASSFPSGGLRATFEARGYTAWDPTSYAFIRDRVLYIPTAFCSYGGEALDQKTPLLRSMEALSRQALRVLKLFGTEATVVLPMVGAEQEYFLVERDMYEQRQDLIYTGRTLYGAMPPKGQEMDDHYFGTVKPRVAAFMREINEELWRVGVTAKTEHNEVAPAQHELACVYNTANIAADHNQLVMDVMQKTAKKHGLVCLLNEKPFEGVNGSGKHNNWSMATDTGINLFDSGETPGENAQFLLFLCAVIKAVDDYQDLLRISVASAGNDHRLGAAEAPPAILSLFLGEELTGILESIENDTACDVREKELFKVGVHALPRFPKDTTDRNRTSPFAFTGNKFEFRMPGSAASISSANIAINTAVAEELRQFADELESAADFKSALQGLIKRVVREHKRIIFNGNGYDPAWVEEAERRGLHNLRSTPEALPHLLALGHYAAVGGQSGVHRGLCAAGADRLDLGYRVRQLHQPARAREHVRQKVRPQPEAEHGHVELVDDVAQLVYLLRRQELRLVRDDDVPAARRLVPRADAVLRRDDLRLTAEADAALHDVRPVPVVHARLDEPDRHAQLLVVELRYQRLGGFRAAHRAVFEVEFSHFPVPRSHVLLCALSACPSPRDCARPRG